MHPAFGSAMHYFAFMNFILSHLTHVDNVLLLYNLISQLIQEHCINSPKYIRPDTKQHCIPKSPAAMDSAPKVLNAVCHA